MNPVQLVSDLLLSRQRLSRLTADLDGDRLLGPKLTIVNPPLWELGHIAWFQEYWCLRRKADGTVAPSTVPGGDALYDSARVAHDTRWGLLLPNLQATRSYQAEVTERVVERLEREPENCELQYFAQLAVFHEDMHAEAFHYTRQTLGYEDPFLKEEGGRRKAEVIPSGDAELPGGPFMLGAAPGEDFVFDNEKWAHEVKLAPFRIARAPVTCAEYLDFLQAGGYGRREWWSDQGWRWKSREALEAPKYWLKRDGAWMQRRFDRHIPLAPDAPVLHVSWHEAQAYCAFAGRRLPTEAEWEYAAAGAGKHRFPWGNDAPGPAHANLESTGVVGVGDMAAGDTPLGLRQMIGNVWEWTESSFGPYPGFVVDPYKEYSEPWFGTHKVLRGGSFATPPGEARVRFRNFYTPDRADIFCGFRTCAA